MFVLLLLLTIAVGCSNERNSIDQVEPPKPIVRVSDKNIPVLQSTYCWISKCADYATPNLLVKDEKPMIVPPESKLTIDFAYKPKERTLSIGQWEGEKSIKQEITNNTIILPKEKGIYVYSFHAQWTEGDSSYAFVVEIR